MAGAVGSSSIAGMATSVHTDIRVRACSYSSGIAQHGGSGRKCGEERMKGRKEEDGKDLVGREGDEDWKRKEWHTVVILFINALRVS